MKAKLTKQDWLEIKTKYEMGHTLSKLSTEYNYDAGNLCNRAKKEGWEQGILQEAVLQQAEDMRKVMDNSRLLQQNISDEQQPIVQQEIMNLANLKIKNNLLQMDTLDFLNKLVKQANSIIVDNPSGIHIKSQTDNGIVYGRNTEIVKDLSSIINGINSQLNPNVGNAVQINNETKSDKVTLNIIGVK